MRTAIWNLRGYIYTLGMCFVLFAVFLAGFYTIFGVISIIGLVPWWAQLIGGLTIGSIIGWLIG